MRSGSQARGHYLGLRLMVILITTNLTDIETSVPSMSKIIELSSDGMGDASTNQSSKSGIYLVL